MTQNGGIDVLIAWCIFGVIVVVLLWFVLRRHADPVELSRRERAQDRQRRFDED